MGARKKQLERALKLHDSLLFVQETKPGRLDIYRKSSLNCDAPHFVFALTDTWSPEGRPVEWGIDVVLNRIKAHDLWKDDNFVNQVIKDNEAHSESKRRSFRNSVEAFVSEFRRDFARATSDINTANMNKKIPMGGF